jgi:hypothetical protein
MSTDVWALARKLWVIVMRHPAERATTLLQAEDAGATWILAFTSEHKAVAAIDLLGVGGTARELPVDESLALVSAVCRVGAAGIMVDFEPEARRCAFLRRLVANA